MLFGRRGADSMSGYNFTDRVRKVLAMAREEATRLRHGYVGTEHILLAIIRERGGVGAAVLQALGIDLDKMRRRIEATVKEGRAAPPSGPELPYTSRAKRVLELAMSEARELNHTYVGTEHLLLGLLREEKGIAAQVINDAGVTLDRARVETLRRLNANGRTAPHVFDVRIDDTSDRSIYEQIVAQVQEAVATGRLGPGDRLQTVRQLADELDIAPGTVARAYAELERLGVVVTEGVRGTRVAPRKESGIPAAERPETLVGLLRPVAVAAFHLGASAEELRAALEGAMKDIFGTGERDAA
ncbi:MAG: Clp protease N-terminal domain-containing protein [Gemmatimonadaceae bacterium]